MKQTPTATLRSSFHWRPGLPIPKLGEGLEPDALGALHRNAAAHERHEREQRKGVKKAA
jgi:hypothetical protein